MKIGIFADMHISTTSSILPLTSSDSKWTRRLKMMKDTYDWMMDIFKEKKVDVIVNLGDFFDSHTLTSEELSLYSEFKPIDIPVFSLVGNHEVLNKMYYSCSILDNVIDEPKLLDIHGCKLAFLPYMKSEDVTSELLSKISSDNCILFSHIDIKGSMLRPDYIMSSGVEPELLSWYFGTVFNGHLHTYEKMLVSDCNIYNIGSVTSKSFSDSNDYIPHISIYDTESKSLEFFDNHNAVLFRKISGNSLYDIITALDKLDSSYEYAIRATVPYSIVKDVNEELRKQDKVSSFRVIGKISNNSDVINNSVNSSVDIADMGEEFINFLEDRTDRKYSMKDYESIIKESFEYASQV